MNTVKTAISIRKSLFRDLDQAARRMHIPRSRLVAQALQEFLEKQKNRELLELLNKTHDGGLTREEKDRLSDMERLHAELVEGEW